MAEARVPRGRRPGRRVGAGGCGWVRVRPGAAGARVRSSSSRRVRGAAASPGPEEGYRLPHPPPPPTTHRLRPSEQLFPAPGSSPSARSRPSGPAAPQPAQGRPPPAGPEQWPARPGGQGCRGADGRAGRGGGGGRGASPGGGPGALAAPRASRAAPPGGRGAEAGRAAGLARPAAAGLGLPGRPPAPPRRLRRWAPRTRGVRGDGPVPPSRGRPRGGVHSRSREGATEPQTFADSRGRSRPQPDSSRGAHLRWRGHQPSRPSCGRAFVPEVPARAPDLLKEKHVGRGRGPREAPGAPAHTRGPDLWRENEAASPRAWRPAKPLCWRHLQSPPRTGCLSPKPPHPEDSPPSRRLRRRSPLRSTGCTAAPEGQTPFGLGKRAPRVILESLGRGPTAGSRGRRARPEVGRRPPRRTYPVGGARAAAPSRAQAWEAEEPLEGKGSQKLNLPRPKAPRPAPGAARTQAPPTKVQGSPRRPGRRSEPRRERKPAR
ncbi:basic salivary proline-rich protein 2-like [Vulpes lagopus]|uniref:basic salivary proline-rich protein 2-like n=1 Tax=Vulpes lagopus TaxID=494514 RepID=UPI001BC9ADB3|nr:basic salivary proline-rich protein 2-like [Vulpes lagopus]